MTAQPKQPPMQWPDVPENILRMLPPVLRAIVRALGINRATRWLKTYGGIYVYLPKYRTSALGLDVDEYTRLLMTLDRHIDAQRRICLPKADKILIMARNAQIRNNRTCSSLSTLARSNNLTRRQIINICNNDDDFIIQTDLFEQNPI